MKRGERECRLNDDGHENDLQFHEADLQETRTDSESLVYAGATIILRI